MRISIRSRTVSYYSFQECESITYSTATPSDPAVLLAKHYPVSQLEQQHRWRPLRWVLQVPQLYQPLSKRYGINSGDIVQISCRVKYEVVLLRFKESGAIVVS